MKKTIATTVLSILLCLMIVGSASAVSIGAGPSTIDFGKLVRGGYAEEEVTVSTSGDEDLTCTVEFLGGLKDWLSVDVGDSFELPANSRVRLKAVVQPPLDAGNGVYEGAIYIKAGPTSSAEGGTGMVVGAGVRLAVKAEITGEEIISYRLKRASVSDTETGYPIKFTAVIENNGNVKVKPVIRIEIYDSAGNLKKTFSQSNVEILPTVESNIPLEVPSDDLEVGQYSAALIVGDEEQTLSFSILERGTLALKGKLNQVSLNKIWVEVGETVKITGDVENTGEILIEDAKLNVEVYLVDEKYKTEKLVKAFTSSESLDIPVGGEVELTSYFTPSTAGRYNIRAVVTYSGKKTPAKATILNVLPTPTNYTPYILAGVVLIIALVVYLARKGEDGRTRRFKKIWGDYLQIK